MQNICKMKLSPTHNVEMYCVVAAKLVTVIEDFCGFLASPMTQSIKQRSAPSQVTAPLAELIPMTSDELEISTTWAGLVQPENRYRSAKETSQLTTVSLLVDTNISFLDPMYEVQDAKPFASFVNLILCGLRAGHGRTGVTATLLLDNPVGNIRFSLDLLSENVQRVFGLRGTQIRFFQDPDLTLEFTNDITTNSLSSQTIFIAPCNSIGTAHCHWNISTRPLCRYVNVDGHDKKGTLLLENPKGQFLTWTEVMAQASVVIGLPQKELYLSRNKDISGIIDINNGQYLSRLDKITLFALHIITII